MTTTRAIITGSTGFVGSHVVERFLAAGMQVVCLLRPQTDPTWLKTLPVELRPLEDPHSLADADIVVHVAGLTRGRSLTEYMSANALATQHLIDAVPRSVRRVVYVSSLAAVGPNPTSAPADEATEPHPYDDYGQSKRAGERVVLDAASRLPVTIVRPPGVYGPRDTNLLPVFRLAQRLGIVPVLGAPDKLFSLIHVQDLAQGIFLAATHPAAIGQTFFLASGTYAMRDMCTALSSALGKPLKLLPMPTLLARLAGEYGQLKWALTGQSQIMSRRKVNDLLQPWWTCNWEKARRMLGYQESWTLQPGLHQTAQWYDTMRWIHPLPVNK